MKVDVHDIEDPDNAPSKLEDLQNEFHAQNITSYPLVSKAKGDATFKSTMTGFFQILIWNAHASDLLYRDALFFENLETWVSAMSDSAIRPFRHTATVIALSMGGTICAVIAAIAEDTAKIMRQKESEQKKKTVNKERVKGLELKVREGERKRDAAQRLAEGIFDAVYANRYRDVDPKIRADCVSLFGTWITACPEVFFSGQFIRYLGWVLSDTAAPTRAETIKQLSRLYKNKEDVGRLRAFTERFRPRLVEMAIRDAEPNVRAVTVDLLGMIRGTGLLEPDDIDNIGRLIFDSEPRVRKAVASFFAENIQDLYESVIDDLGGEEDLDEILGEENEDDFDSPRKPWLMFKCLAESLQGYDAEEEGTASDTHIAIATGEDSRSALAAQAVCDGVKELEKWEVLAGYLLYDLSNVNMPSTDPEATFKARCQLSERENVLLLEVLHVAIKSTLVGAIQSETDSKGKSTKARKERSRELQESTALHLAQVIPRMLKKFRGNPATATAVLRLGQVLNLEIFQELRQDSTTYASLLDDINKQFLAHVDQGVLTEATTALLHARSFEDLEEVTESKVNELWEDTVSNLRGIQGDFEENLPELYKCVRRIQHLARISDCTSQFESQPRATKKTPSTESILNFLQNLIRQCSDQSDIDAESIETADQVIQSATLAVLFYYMWVVRSLRDTIEEGKQTPPLPSFEPFSQTLLSTMDSRSLSDSARLAAAGAYLDLHTLFATFRHLAPAHQPSQIKIQHIPASANPLLRRIFTLAEKSFAKKSHRALEPDDAPPEEDSSIEEPPSDDEDDEDDSNEPQHQHPTTSTLLAEKSLCELTGKLVLAILARVLDADGTLKARLLRNKTRLGPNYKEVVKHLEPPKQAAKRKPTATRTETKKKQQEVVHQGESVEDEEDEEEERQFEEGGEEDLRQRELEDDIEQEEEEEEQRDKEADADDEIMGD